MLATPGFEVGRHEKQIRDGQLYARLSRNHHGLDGSIEFPELRKVPAKSTVRADTPELNTQPNLAPEKADALLDSDLAPEQVKGLAEASTASESEPSIDRSEGMPIYFRSSLLDRPPVPHSAPNPRKYLSTTPSSTLPIYLRLYIDKSGKVVEINVRTMELLDDSLVFQAKEMFFATSFIPGNIKGVDVPSYIDIELELSEYSR
jgi:hypothetical protein